MSNFENHSQVGDHNAAVNFFLSVIASHVGGDIENHPRRSEGISFVALALEAFSGSIPLEAKRRFNSMLPINTLPKAVLIQILHGALLDEDEDEDFRPTIMHAPDDPKDPDAYPTLETAPLLALTHVCAHWRRALIETPSFWTHVDCHSYAQLQTFCERAGPLPMCITAHYDDVEPPIPISYEGSKPVHAILESVIVPLMPRLHQLDIVVLTHGYHSLWDPPAWIFTVSAPLLTVANVRVEHGPKTGTHDVRLGVSLGKPKETKVLFGNAESSLKALALTGISSWVPGNLFPLLTHLFLSFDRDDNLAVINDMDLFTLLTNAPNLEFLHFDNMLVATPDDMPLPRYRAWLPRLRLMAFTAHCVGALDVFKYMSVPASARIRVNNAAILGEEFPPLSGFLQDDASTASTLEFMIPNHLCRVHLTFFGPLGGFWMEVFVFESDWLKWIEDCFTRIPQEIPLRHVATLRLSVPQADSSALAALMQHMAHITTLEIELHTAAQLQYFCAMIGSFYGTGAAAHPAACAALNAVTVVTPTLNWMDPTELARCAQMLADAVRWRAVFGRPIRRFVVQPVCLQERLRTPERERAKAEVRAAFDSLNLAQYVGELRLIGPRVGSVIRWMEGDADEWDVEGEFDYWDMYPGIEPEVRPEYP